ncbi:MAG TPA: FxSxx-COOH system tetratricopeptide repeat protein [Ktedonobacteraceae bacterium]|jgi:tetratricopeptide (TPR) repeat protein|nr:FxSxx-COOH system tetratricopeptide repeat protein [Ktedonobacteraceae bacterium]
MDKEVLLLSNFGEALKAARKRKRFTQKQLAQLLGVHYNTISSWELGSYLPETRGLILELARHLALDGQETRQLLEASLTALSPYWNVPYQRNPFFTGRDCILRQMHSILHHEHNATLGHSCALSGLGGIGKTQTIIEYAYRYANNYSAVFWVGGQTYENIISSFVTIANALKLPEGRIQEQKLVADAVIRWLNNHDQWLLIFDNVENIALVKSFLPAARHGSLLFTSRRQAFGITAQVLDLEPMTPEEGMHFLLHRARLLDTTTPRDLLAQKDEEIAQKIVSAMDGFPLALDQAGSYVEATQCSLSDYLQLYQSSQLHLLDERDIHADHPLSVTRTFTLIFEQLECYNTQAAELLTVCAFLAPEAIPETFFHCGAAYLGPAFEDLFADPFAFHTLIKVLLTYSLLQRNADTQTVTVHRLVQAVLKGRLPEAVQRMWATRVICAMSHLFPSEEAMQANYWLACEQLLPHALVCITLSEEWSIDETLHITLMNNVATYLSKRAHYTEAEPLFLRALSLGEQVLGPEHFLVAEALHNLGTLYLQQGMHSEAETLLLLALNIEERTLGIQHPRVAASLNGLAMLYLQQRIHSEAETLLLRALSIEEQTLGIQHPQVATSLNGLAILYGEQGKYKQAEIYYARALNIREQTLGVEHPQVATLLNNMARDYSELGKYEQAEPLFLRALHIWEQDLGSDHPRVAYPLHNLADLYSELGKYEQAEPLFLRALHIWEQGLGPEHFLVADSLDGLALLYRKQGKYEQAEPLFLRALQIRKRAFGPQHPTVADSLHQLAHFYQLQQQTAKALSLYEQALALYGLTPGSHHLKMRATYGAYLQLLRELEHEEQVSRAKDGCVQGVG